MFERSTGPRGDWEQRGGAYADQPLLNVTFPTYTGERRLRPTLDRVTAYLASELDTWERLVVDDGSTDQTVLTARVFAEQ